MRVRQVFFQATAFVGGLAASVNAEQTTTPDGKVVHTRLAPVAVHRVFPPYTGIHVYARGPRGRAASLAESESAAPITDEFPLPETVYVFPGPVVYPGAMMSPVLTPWSPYSYSVPHYYPAYRTW